MSVTIQTSAGRRGAGSIDCRVCGQPIHQRANRDNDYDESLPWFDGHGENVSVGSSMHRGSPSHQHTPALEIGPSFTYEYAELTYNTLRVDEGELLAVWNDGRGDWVLTDLAGEHAGEAYSDITIGASA